MGSAALSLNTEEQTSCLGGGFPLIRGIKKDRMGYTNPVHTGARNFCILRLFEVSW